MYMLKELDELQLTGNFKGNKLKKFHPGQRLELDFTSNLDHEDMPTLNSFFASESDSELSDTPDNF